MLWIDPDLHPLEHLQVFFREIEVCGLAIIVVVAGVRPQANLEPQRQLHLVTSFAQTFNGLSYFRRVLNRLVDRASDLANYLFCFVIDFQGARMLRHSLPIANWQIQPSAIGNRQC